MIKLGLKRLTKHNWLKPDQAMSHYYGLQEDGAVCQPIGVHWIENFLEPDLDESIPLEVRKLYESARGMLAYGYFFYPLYALGLGQLCRVAETAIRHKCRQIGIKVSKRKFKKLIDEPVSTGIIGDRKPWDAIRHYRNSASHPEEQNIVSPGIALSMLNGLTTAINSLFREPRGNQ